jgi:hypothetical protein
MKRVLGCFVTMLALISSNSAKANEAGKANHWVCTATAWDDTSVFFWAMAKTRAEAYRKAMHKCERAERTCDSSCEYVNFNI